jgi:hypothetical protein
MPEAALGHGGGTGRGTWQMHRFLLQNFRRVRAHWRHTERSPKTARPQAPPPSPGRSQCRTGRTRRRWDWRRGAGRRGGGGRSHRLGPRESPRSAAADSGSARAGLPHCGACASRRLRRQVRSDVPLEGRLFSVTPGIRRDGARLPHYQGSRGPPGAGDWHQYWYQLMEISFGPTAS